MNGLTILDEVLVIISLSQERYGLPLVSTDGSDSLTVRFIASISLIHKYISIHIYDEFTHTLLKCFDLLEQLTGLAEQPESTWSDYEASAILPALIG
ncbi:hypothetical protein FBU59_003274 [Linderina macrospora]|uniref:Uncharacterized protein n=1 Tax=Linderina macrospora TaxID=4868 RepID=A0ACC1J8Z8_9FUNG|nr:hypothetical protein FBU59_003274 [Linderina macrospora]